MKNLKWLVAVVFAGLVALSALGEQISTRSYYGDVLCTDVTTDISPRSPGSLAKGKSVTVTATAPVGMNFSYWGVSKGQSSVTWDENEKNLTYTYTAKSDQLSPTTYLCARFDYIPLEIKFNGNSATSGKMESIKNLNILSSFTLTQNTYQKTGHTFAGWKNSAGKTFKDAQQVKGEDFWVSSENKFDGELSAQWTPNSYDLKLTLMDGVASIWYSVNESAWQEVTGSTTIPVPYDQNVRAYATAKEGYVCEDSSQNPWTHRMGINGLEFAPLARREGYRLTVDPNKGSFKNQNDRYTFNERLLYGQTNLNSIGIAIKESGEFKGFSDSKGEPVYDENGKNVKGTYWTADYPCGTFLGTADLEVKAIWGIEPPSVKISTGVDPDGAGQCTGGGEKCEIGTEVILEAISSPGYSFACWRKGDKEVSSETPYTFEADESTAGAYIAVFTGNWYTVTYNGLRTLQDKMAKTVQFGEEYGEPPYEPQTEQYRLEGWYTQADGQGLRIDPTNVVNIANDHTLYANWIEIPTYTIAFDGMGATSGTMENQIVPCGEEAKLSANIFEKAGHEFLGWATNDVSEVVYTNGETVVDLAAQGETITLYAVWEANEYTVIFEPGDDVIWSGTLTNACTYGIEWQIPTCVPTNKNELLQFAGWQQEGVAEPYPAGATVSNLTAEADGVVTLKATWKFDEGDYSRALGCTNLVFVADDNSGWKVVAGEPGKNPKAQSVKHSTDAPTDALRANILGGGTLTFCWRATRKGMPLRINTEQFVFTFEGGDDWTPESVKLSANTRTIEFTTLTGEGNDVWIADVRWTPDGDAPTEGDRREITAMTVSADGLSFGFSDADPRWTYALRGTNELTATRPWPEVFSTNGATGAVKIDVPKPADEPSMFYYLEVR